MDHHAISLHCTHVMAVKDRIDCSALSDECQSFDIASVHLADVLAKERDLSAVKDNLTILTSRIVRLHMPFFRKHGNANSVPRHIEHQHSTEMSSKSEVVRVI